MVYQISTLEPFFGYPEQPLADIFFDFQADTSIGSNDYVSMLCVSNIFFGWHRHTYILTYIHTYIQGIRPTPVC